MKFIDVKDFSVSGELFQLHEDDFLDLLVTTPKPEKDKLTAYYESDDYISHTDSKRTFFEKIYHFVRTKTLKNKLDLINHKQPKKGIILDIGTGTGDFLHLAKNDGWQVFGIEPSLKAKEKAIEKGVGFVPSIYELQDNSFDVITMWHVLEHVYDLEEQIAQLYRIIKPSGTIIIAVPNYKSYDALHYGSFWAAYDVPRHLWHFSKKSIQILFKKQHLYVNQILPMKWDAFYVSFLSEKYKKGRINYFKALYIGWISNRKAKKSMEYSSLIYVISKNEKQQYSSIYNK